MLSVQTRTYSPHATRRRKGASHRGWSSGQPRSGNVMIVMIIMIVVFTVIGLGLAQTTITALTNSVENWDRGQATAAADAGVDYACHVIQQNVYGWWSAGAAGPPTNPLTGTLPSGGSFSVTVADDSSGLYPTGSVLITSTGTSSRETVTVLAATTVTGVNAGAWTNAIFAGDEQSSSGNGLFHGNSTIAGSVHIRGDFIGGTQNPVLTTTTVISGNGSGGLYNNYQDSGGIGAFPTSGYMVPSTGIVLGDPSPQDLRTYLRVKIGMVNMGSKDLGTTTNSAGNVGSLAGILMGLGAPNNPGYNNPIGAQNWTGGVPTTHVQSNASGQPNIGPYDLNPNSLPFPDLLNSLKVQGRPYNNYFDFLGQSPGGVPNALRYTGNSGNNLIVTSGTIILPTSSGPNSIKCLAGVLTVNGVVWVQDGKIDISGVKYEGSGVLVAGGHFTSTASGAASISGPQDITIDDWLPNTAAVGLSYGQALLSGRPGGFPNNVVALVSTRDITMGTGSHASDIGACFAENKANILHAQGNFAGTIVCKDFTIFNNNDLFYVPDLVHHLPVGLPGADPFYINLGTQIARYNRLQQ